MLGAHRLTHQNEYCGATRQFLTTQERVTPEPALACSSAEPSTATLGTSVSKHINVLLEKCLLLPTHNIKSENFVYFWICRNLALKIALVID